MTRSQLLGIDATTGEPGDCARPGGMGDATRHREEVIHGGPGCAERRHVTAPVPERGERAPRHQRRASDCGRASLDPLTPRGVFDGSRGHLRDPQAQDGSGKRSAGDHEGAAARRRDAERERIPHAFRDALLAMARSAQTEEDAG